MIFKLLNMLLHRINQYTMLSNDDNITEPPAKRQRVVNQIKTEISTASNRTIRQINNIDGLIKAQCYNKDSTQLHNIVVGVQNGNYIFECDCNKYDGKNTSHCKHLNTVIVQLCKNFIDVSTDTMIKKDKSDEFKMKMNDLTDFMQNAFI